MTSRDRPALEPQLRASSLEAVKAGLRMFGKVQNEVDCRSAVQLGRRGWIKSYIVGESTILAHARIGSAPAEDFYLAFVRLPDRARIIAGGDHERGGSGADGEGFRRDDGRLGDYFETDRVLAVRETRHGALNGQSALIPIPSRVWLLASDEIPKSTWDDLFPGFLVSQLPFESVGVVAPRVVSLPSSGPNQPAGSVDGSVERVFRVQQSIIDLPFGFVRNGGLELEGCDSFAGQWINLFDSSDVVVVEEPSFQNGIRLVRAAICPIDQFLRLREC